MNRHWAIFIDNNSNKSDFIKALLSGNIPPRLAALQFKKGALFSKIALERLMEEEDRHENKVITQDTAQSLRSMSSGEQKKALLRHLLSTDPDYIILDNPFDNLDTISQLTLADTLAKRSNQILFVQIISRKADLLSFISNHAFLHQSELIFDTGSLNLFTASLEEMVFSGAIPEPLQAITYHENVLIDLKNITVRYGHKTILKSINWTIRRGELWQLIGRNGSGKTTILSMITGENPKGYGQELYLFGQKKGSGESIWDIKKKIGYFTPAMTDKFNGYHTVEHMLISGLTDSIGLYIRPTESQLRLAKQWLSLIGMWTIKDRLFSDLSIGQQRLIMTVRAMLKHPLLLILDEPTAGLDDASAALLVALVNKIARESDTTTIFVSHRKEPGLEPDFIYELKITREGSVGTSKHSKT
ncbi:MAG: ATP-binding cassette domain-containing protein [Flavobacteriaceae bacterium]